MPYLPSPYLSIPYLFPTPYATSLRYLPTLPPYADGLSGTEAGYICTRSRRPLSAKMRDRLRRELVTRVAHVVTSPPMLLRMPYRLPYPPPYVLRMLPILLRVLAMLLRCACAVRGYVERGGSKGLSGSLSLSLPLSRSVSLSFSVSLSRCLSVSVCLSLQVRIEGETMTIPKTGAPSPLPLSLSEARRHVLWVT
eukprot:2216412-Rhodomonas_salina.1